MSQDFEDIVKRLRPRLIREAAKVVGHAYAEDVVQTTLANEYRAVMKDAAAYLIEAVRRDAQDFAKGEERDFARIEDHVARHGTPMVVEDVEAVERGIDVRRALEKLPADIRDAVIAVVVEGVTEREYAEEAGVSQQMVNKRVQRGLEFLRARLSDEPPASTTT